MSGMEKHTGLAGLEKALKRISFDIILKALSNFLMNLT